MGKPGNTADDHHGKYQSAASKQPDGNGFLHDKIELTIYAERQINSMDFSAGRLTMLFRAHQTLLVAHPLFLFLGFAFVMLFLAFGQADFELDFARLIVHIQRHQTCSPRARPYR